MTDFPSFVPQITRDGLSGYFMGQNTEHVERALLGLFVQAIAEFEGFYIDGSISQRHNNPGNLRPIGASTGFRSFETPSDGWLALSKQVLLNISRGLTLREFFLGKEGVYPGYAPLGDNPADVMENYISFVRNRTNFQEGMILGQYFPTISKIDPEMLFPYSLLWLYKPFYT